MLKISVIIPVYKVEPYLRQCVDSVLSQTYESIEVILIDDGSPDNCPHICDQYANADARVKVIHQTNGGLSAARNTGVQCASGEYVVFLDSDDFWNSPAGLDKIVSRLEKKSPDVLNFAYIRTDELGNAISERFRGIESMPFNISGLENQLAYLTSGSLYIASAWNKIVRREIAIETPFEEGKTSEDIDWCARLICKAESIDFACENLYCYRQRRGSITHNFSERNCIDLKDNILKCIAITGEVHQNRKEFLETYTAYQLATFFAVQALASNCPKECVAQLCKHQKILRHHGTSKKVAYLDLGCRLMGFANMCRITRLTRRFWS